MNDLTAQHMDDSEGLAQTSRSADHPKTWHTVALVMALVFVAWALPPLTYLLVYRTPTVLPAEAEQLLRQQPQQSALVDVRTIAEYQAGHIDGAVNWPLADLLVADAAMISKRDLQSKKVLVVSAVGIDGIAAMRRLHQLGVVQSTNIRGGIQEWIWTATQSDRWNINGQVGPPPAHPIAQWQQGCAVLAFFVIKPIYTILALLVIVLLWESTERDLRAIFWAIWFFVIGEMACAVNVLVFADTSYVLEYVHSTGMVICMGFAGYAFLDGFDSRVIHLSAPERRCAAIGLCRRCIKNEDVPCKLRRLFYILLPLCAGAACMLLTANWQDEAFNTRVFGHIHHVGHAHVFQVFENQLCPLAAIGLFLAAMLALWKAPRSNLVWSQILFAAGCGALGFGALRGIIGGLYHDTRVWYGFWEEATELMFIVLILGVLWTFQSSLLPRWISRWHAWIGRDPRD